MNKCYGLFALLAVLILLAGACKKTETDGTLTNLGALLALTGDSGYWNGSGCVKLYKFGTGTDIVTYAGSGWDIPAENCNSETLGDTFTSDVSVAKAAYDTAYDDIKAVYNSYPDCASLVAGIDTEKAAVTTVSLAADVAGKAGDADEPACVKINVGVKIGLDSFSVTPGELDYYCSNDTQIALVKTDRKFRHVGDLRTDMKMDLDYRLERRIEQRDYFNFTDEALQRGRPINLAEYNLNHSAANAAYLRAQDADVHACSQEILKGNPELRSLVIAYYGSSEFNPNGVSVAEAQAVEQVLFSQSSHPLFCGYMPDGKGFRDAQTIWGHMGECPRDYPRF